MDLYRTSALAAALVNFALAAVSTTRRRQEPHLRPFAWLALLQGLLHIQLLLYDSHVPALGPTLVLFCMPPPTMASALALLGPKRLRRPGALRALWGCSAACFVVALTGIFSLHTLRLASVAYTALFGSLLNVLIWQGARTSMCPLMRLRLRILLACGVGMMLLWLTQYVPPIAWMCAWAHVAATIYMYALYQALVVPRVLDVIELAGRLVALLMLAVALPPVLGTLALAVRVPGQELWVLRMLLATLTMVLGASIIGPRIGALGARLVLPSHRGLSAVVPQLLRSLRSTVSLRQMQAEVLTALALASRFGEVALFASHDGGRTLRCTGARGYAAGAWPALPRGGALQQELLDGRRVLIEELYHRREVLSGSQAAGPSVAAVRAALGAALREMKLLRATIVVPIQHQGVTVGALLLGAPRGGMLMARAEVAALEQVAEACADVVQTSAVLWQSRRRAGRAHARALATTLMRELRNPLTAIRGAAECLAPLALPAPAHALLDVIVAEVGRLDGAVEHALGTQPGSSSVNAAVLAALGTATPGSWPQGEVLPQLTAALPAVAIEAQLLQQVLRSLLAHARREVGPATQLHVCTARDGPSGAVRITIADAQGTSPQLACLLVAHVPPTPGFVGLTLAACRRIIERSGGTLEVLGSPSIITALRVHLLASAG